MIVIGLLLLTTLGLFMLIKLEICWKIEHIFSVKNGEPTELYLLFLRLDGLIFLLAAIITAFISLATAFPILG